MVTLFQCYRVRLLWVLYINSVKRHHFLPCKIWRCWYCTFFRFRFKKKTKLVHKKRNKKNYRTAQWGSKKAGLGKKCRSRGCFKKKTKITANKKGRKKFTGCFLFLPFLLLNFGFILIFFFFERPRRSAIWPKTILNLQITSTQRKKSAA